MRTVLCALGLFLAIAAQSMAATLEDENGLLSVNLDCDAFVFDGSSTVASDSRSESQTSTVAKLLEVDPYAWCTYNGGDDRAKCDPCASRAARGVTDLRDAFALARFSKRTELQAKSSGYTSGESTIVDSYAQQDLSVNSPPGLFWKMKCKMSFLLPAIDLDDYNDATVNLSLYVSAPGIYIQANYDHSSESWYVSGSYLDVNENIVTVSQYVTDGDVDFDPIYTYGIVEGDKFSIVARVYDGSWPTGSEVQSPEGLVTAYINPEAYIRVVDVLPD